ncbi:MAG: DsbA family protein [Ilumatobacteraceae bacterium]|nr:DsbA family protein [Ilumatobacteraceae bacterium]
MKAYFTDGLNVGDADVVAQCAADVNLDGEAIRMWLSTDEGFDAVQEDLQGAAMREITAVPSFVIDDRFLIPGAQDVDVFVNVLERALTR